MIQNDVLAKFKEIFGDEGDIRVYFAPGRVNLSVSIPITMADTYFHVHLLLEHTWQQEREPTGNCVFIP